MQAAERSPRSARRQRKQATSHVLEQSFNTTPPLSQANHALVGGDGGGDYFFISQASPQSKIEFLRTTGRAGTTTANAIAIMMQVSGKILCIELNSVR